MPQIVPYDAMKDIENVWLRHQEDFSPNKNSKDLDVYNLRCNNLDYIDVGYLKSRLSSRYTRFYFSKFRTYLKSIQEAHRKKTTSS